MFLLERISQNKKNKKKTHDEDGHFDQAPENQVQAKKVFFKTKMKTTLIFLNDIHFF